MNNEWGHKRRPHWVKEIIYDGRCVQLVYRLAQLVEQSTALNHRLSQASLCLLGCLHPSNCWPFPATPFHLGDVMPKLALLLEDSSQGCIWKCIFICITLPTLHLQLSSAPFKILSVRARGIGLIGHCIVKCHSIAIASVFCYFELWRFGFWRPYSCSLMRS